jgi:hypothetical protein
MNIIPVKIVVRRPLEQKDEQFMQIENAIHAKRQMLLEKQKKFKAIEEQNEFLSHVKEDYAKYYQYISQQKQDQIKALELLNTYIHDLTHSGHLSKHNEEDARIEQKNIMREMNSIRKGLDSIMQNSDSINSTLQAKNFK